MINFDFDEFCSGCGACYSICPKKAISMKPNKEGFLIPYVDNNKCVNCDLCKRVCVHLNHAAKCNATATWTYASKDNDAKRKSSSGAAWFEIGKHTLKEGGLVAGCIWNKELKAIHSIGNSMQTLISTQGSKYVQSDIGDVLKEIVIALKHGNKIVFSGTPCQATAAHNVIVNSSASKYRDNAIIVAVICHGVSSPLAWESYKTWDEAKHHSKLVSINFRDKSKEGYKKSYCRYEYESGEIAYLPTYLPSSKWMESTIVYNLAMRKACAHCDCKGIHKSSDLILGDWYSQYKGEGSLGTSCIVACTKRGAEYVKNSLDNLHSLEYSSVLKENPLIEKSSHASPNRKLFFNKITDFNFWDKVESLYPAKYPLKKLLVKIGIFDFIKRITR